VPKSFETRNLGTTLEVEASVFEDGKRIGLSIVPQRVILLNMETFAMGVTKDGATVRIDQPQFTSEKTTTELVVRNGERILLAVHQLHTPENEIEFFILHAAASRTD
jgi:type II secretory pathway component GspD/PulD (secretin)